MTALAVRHCVSFSAHFAGHSDGMTAQLWVQGRGVEAAEEGGGRGAPRKSFIKLMAWLKAQKYYSWMAFPISGRLQGGL